MDGQLKQGNKEPKNKGTQGETSLTRQIHQNSLFDVHPCRLPLGSSSRRVDLYVVRLGTKDDRMFW